MSLYAGLARTPLEAERLATVGVVAVAPTRRGGVDGGVVIAAPAPAPAPALAPAAAPAPAPAPCVLLRVIVAGDPPAAADATRGVSGVTVLALAPARAPPAASTLPCSMVTAVPLWSAQKSWKAVNAVSSAALGSAGGPARRDRFTGVAEEAIVDA